jgi:hypothetical protein
MSIARYPIEQTDPPRSAKETLPTMYDLPSEDTEESGLPDEFHLWQSELCSATFCPSTYSPDPPATIFPPSGATAQHHRALSPVKLAPL